MMNKNNIYAIFASSLILTSCGAATFVGSGLGSLLGTDKDFAGSADDFVSTTGSIDDIGQVGVDGEDGTIIPSNSDDATIKSGTSANSGIGTGGTTGSSGSTTTTTTTSNGSGSTSNTGSTTTGSGSNGSSGGTSGSSGSTDCPRFGIACVTDETTKAIIVVDANGSCQTNMSNFICTDTGYSYSSLNGAAAQDHCQKNCSSKLCVSTACVIVE